MLTVPQTEITIQPVTQWTVTVALKDYTDAGLIPELLESSNHFKFKELVKKLQNKKLANRPCVVSDFPEARHVCSSTANYS